MDGSVAKSPLPYFARPPVSEVGLSVSFEPIDSLDLIQIIRLYDGPYKDEYPRIEQKPFNIIGQEHFGPGPQMPSIQLRLGDRAPVRCWFLDASGTNLVQLQQDWVARNWRKIPKDTVYPRYTYVREHFEQDIRLLQDFVQEQKLGSLEPGQCEITYVNALLPVRDVWADHSDISAIIRPWSDSALKGSLPKPEDAQFNVSYLIESAGVAVGRLRVALQPVFSVDDQLPTYLLTLTARGGPLGGGFAGVMAFLDLGHERIVRAFDAVTTDALHTIWGKK